MGFTGQNPQFSRPLGTLKSALSRGHGGIPQSEERRRRRGGKERRGKEKRKGEEEVRREEE